MAVPRNRLSRSRTGNRRAHQAKSPKTISFCHNCAAKKLPHTLCPSCGTYAGRTVVQKESA